MNKKKLKTDIIRNMRRFTFDKLITAMARFLSSALSPLLMPAYGVFLTLWVSFLCSLAPGVRWAVVMVVFGITCIMPVILIAILHNFKIITDKRLDNRRERLIPYIGGIVCSIAAAFYLGHIHSPVWFVMFQGGAALTALVLMLVNLKWKISAHLAGIGGVVALLYQIHVQGLEAFNLFWVICAAIFVAGMLGSSRIILGRHTFPQVAAGFFVGYASVTLMISCFG